MSISRISLLVIILATGVMSLEFDVSRVGANPLFALFGQELTLGEIEKKYLQFASEKLEYQINAIGDLPQVLAELATFNTQVLDDNSASVISKENVQAMVKILIKHEEDILGNHLKPLENSMVQFFKAVAKKLVHYNMSGSLADYFVSVESIKEAVDTFKQERELILITVDGLVEYISQIHEEFVSSYLGFYEIYIAFRNGFEQQVDDLIKSLIEMIFTGQIEVTEKSRDISIDKLIALMKTVTLITTKGSHPMNYIFKLASDEIINRQESDNLTPIDFKKNFLQKIFNTFKKSQDSEVMLLGKALFLKIFMPDSYFAPDRTYIRFVMRKYAREGLKRNCASAFNVFASKAQGVYIADLLYSSLKLKKEILKEEDLDWIFDQFSVYYSNWNKEHLVVFNGFRHLFMSYSDSIFQYEGLFDSLFDTGIYSSVYMVAFEAWHRSSDWSVNFNTYVDYAYSVNLGRISKHINFANPKNAHFKVNIANNYLFYKLVNLDANYEKFLGDKDIT